MNIKINKPFNIVLPYYKSTAVAMVTKYNEDSELKCLFFPIFSFLYHLFQPLWGNSTIVQKQPLYNWPHTVEIIQTLSLLIILSLILVVVVKVVVVVKSTKVFCLKLLQRAFYIYPHIFHWRNNCVKNVVKNVMMKYMFKVQSYPIVFAVFLFCFPFFGEEE